MILDIIKSFSVSAPNPHLHNFFFFSFFFLRGRWRQSAASFGLHTRPARPVAAVVTRYRWRGREKEKKNIKKTQPNCFWRCQAVFISEAQSHKSQICLQGPRSRHAVVKSGCVHHRERTHSYTKVKCARKKQTLHLYLLYFCIYGCFFFAAHTPDNSFLGFVVEQHLNASDIKHIDDIKRQNQSLVYGKVDNFWKVRRSLCSRRHAEQKQTEPIAR